MEIPRLRLYQSVSIYTYSRRNRRDCRFGKMDYKRSPFKIHEVSEYISEKTIISINVSVIQMIEPSFVQMIEEVLETGLTDDI